MNTASNPVSHEESAYWRAREAAHRARADASTSEWARRSWLGLAEGCARYAMQSELREARLEQAAAPFEAARRIAVAVSRSVGSDGASAAPPSSQPSRTAVYCDMDRTLLRTRPLRLISNNDNGTANNRVDYWRKVASDYHAEASKCRLPEIRAVWENLASLCEDLANANLKTMRRDIARDEAAARWRQRMNAYQLLARRERIREARQGWTALADRCEQVADRLESGASPRPSRPPLCLPQFNGPDCKAALAGSAQSTPLQEWPREMQSTR